MKLMAKSYRYLIDKLSTSLRLEIIVTFIICIVTALALGNITKGFLQLLNGTDKPEHNIMQRINAPAISLANTIEQSNYSIGDQQQLGPLLQNLATKQGSEIIISDAKGRVYYQTARTAQAAVTQVDITALTRNFLNASQGDRQYLNELRNNRAYTSFYPVRFRDENGYIIIQNQLGQAMPTGESSIIDIEFIASMVTFLTFLATFILLTNKKMHYIEQISAGLLEISEGNLDYQITRQGQDELALLADNINFMAAKLKAQIENERNAEKVKNELITNVSHDLRTPLTSIKGYLEVIRGQKQYDQKKIEQYLNIVYSKSEKLEKLVNDLFEYTKLVNKAVSIDWQKIELNQLLAQLIEEFVPTCTEHQVTMTRNFLKDKLVLELDPDKTVRIFENLLSNAIKYSTKPSEIMLELRREAGWAVVCIKNYCEAIDTMELGRVFERFYRLDQSRSSDRGGSGLGLAIAKSLVELQGGTIEAQYVENQISFIVKFQLCV